jgi:hypothetical protein
LSGLLFFCLIFLGVNVTHIAHLDSLIKLINDQIWLPWQLNTLQKKANFLIIERILCYNYSNFAEIDFGLGRNIFILGLERGEGVGEGSDVVSSQR